MINKYINYVFFGDCISKKKLYSKEKPYNTDIAKEALMIFEKTNNSKFKNREKSKMAGNKGNFYFLIDNNIFYLICTSKQCSDKLPFQLLEEIVTQKIAIKLKSYEDCNSIERFDELENDECVSNLKKLIEEFTNYIEKEASDNSDINKADLSILAPDERKNLNESLIPIDDNNREMGKTRVSGNKISGENKRNSKTYCSKQNIIMIIILSIITIAICLVLLIPIGL